MQNEPASDLITHLEALRRTLLKCLTVTALLFPAGYFLAPYVTEILVQLSFPENAGKLHYFSPLEVFWVQLKLALIIALAGGYPVNIFFIWKFLLPALYCRERRTLRIGIIFSAVLFISGVVFCAIFLLPLLMRFSAGFADEKLIPVLGIANFIHLAGWLMLAFGMVFQVPLLVLLAVKAGLITADSLAGKRLYVVVVILTAAALLTPPDVISQLMLAIPAWLLFECGLFLARRIER